MYYGDLVPLVADHTNQKLYVATTDCKKNTPARLPVRPKSPGNSLHPSPTMERGGVQHHHATEILSFTGHLFLATGWPSQARSTSSWVEIAHSHAGLLASSWMIAFYVHWSMGTACYAM